MKALPQWTFNLLAYTHACKQAKEKYNKIHIHKHAKWVNTTHPGQQLISIWTYLMNWFLMYCIVHYIY